MNQSKQYEALKEIIKAVEIKIKNASKDYLNEHKEEPGKNSVTSNFINKTAEEIRKNTRKNLNKLKEIECFLLSYIF